jgi:hypothetical protein
LEDAVIPVALINPFLELTASQEPVKPDESAPPVLPVSEVETERLKDSYASNGLTIVTVVALDDATANEPSEAFVAVTVQVPALVAERFVPLIEQPAVPAVVTAYETAPLPLPPLDVSAKVSPKNAVVEVSVRADCAASANLTITTPEPPAPPTVLLDAPPPPDPELAAAGLPLPGSPGVPSLFASLVPPAPARLEPPLPGLPEVTQGDRPFIPAPPPAE